MRALLLILLLAGCTTVGHQRVENWPAFKVTEHVVPYGELMKHCGHFVPWWARVLTWIGTPGMPVNVMGCAVIHFDTNTCDIWIREGMDPEVHEDVVEHERQHCDGYDHEGATAFRDALARHRRL
jgi:hypothetical protein